MPCVYMLIHSSIREKSTKAAHLSRNSNTFIEPWRQCSFLMQRANFKILQIKVVFIYKVMKNKFTIPKEVYFAFRHFIGSLGRSNL